MLYICYERLKCEIVFFSHLSRVIDANSKAEEQEKIEQAAALDSDLEEISEDELENIIKEDDDSKNEKELEEDSKQQEKGS